MPRRRFATDQIIQHLRKAEVHLSQGRTVTQVCKMIGITDQTYYRWRKKYGGLRTDQAKRRQAVDHVRESRGRSRVSERRACRGWASQDRHSVVDIGFPRMNLLWSGKWSSWPSSMAVAVIVGYTELLCRRDWKVNHKRIERLWRREGLKVPQKQLKRRRLWFNDGSCA